jgi:hypothetical protein
MEQKSSSREVNNLSASQDVPNNINKNILIVKTTVDLCSKNKEVMVVCYSEIKV